MLKKNLCFKLKSSVYASLPLIWRKTTNWTHSDYDKQTHRAPLKSPHGAAAAGAGRDGRVHVPGVVGVRSQLDLPGHVAPIVPDLHLGFHLQLHVVLRHGPRVGALLGAAHEDAVRVGGIHRHLVALLPVQKQALQRHRVLLGQEERRLRHVLARREHLPGALQVEQDAGAGGVVDVPVVLQELVVEQAVVPQADGLRNRKEIEKKL